MTQRLAPIALLLTITLAAHAAPKTTPTSSAAQAKAALARLNQQLQTAQTMHFACTVTFPNQQATKTGPGHLSVQGYVERPNKFYIEAKRDATLAGVIVSNSKTGFVYNGATRKYTQMTKGYQDYTVLDKDIRQNFFFLTPGAMFLEGPSIFRMGTFVGSMQDSYTVSSATINNISTTVITQHLEDPHQPRIVKTGGSGGVQVVQVLSLGKDSGLPVRYVQSLLVFGHPILIAQYDFRSFQIGNSPMSASAFSWTPPADAKLFRPSP